MEHRGDNTAATNQKSLRKATTRRPARETACQHRNGKLRTLSQLDGQSLLLERTRFVDKSCGTLGNKYMTLTEKIDEFKLYLQFSSLLKISTSVKTTYW